MQRKFGGLCVTCLLCLHVVLVAWGAVVHSPVLDEVGHLPAGVSHWKFGQFTLYKVNPPLVRAIAALPVALWADPDMGWEAFTPVNVLICCHFRIYGITPSSIYGVTWCSWRKERQGCCWADLLRRLSKTVRSV